MDKIEELLKMTERQQDYTDEELERVLADDEMWGYYELMLCAEQGFACRREQRRNRGLMIRRIAAIVLVVLTLSGLTFATMLHFRDKESREQTAQQAAVTSVVPVSQRQQPVEPAADSLQLFKNVELEKILSELSAYYHVTVSFQQEQSKHLRLYTKWNRAESLAQVIDRLNGFEKVNIVQRGEQLTVE
jgi:hypothetical protein